MTAPNPGMPALLSSDDFGTFSELDNEWFLTAAGAAIRKYAGWHIFPSIQETRLCSLSGDGSLIMLPSAYVTSVDAITAPWSQQTIDPSVYFLDRSASVVRWLHPRCSGWWGASSTGSTAPYPKYAAKVEVLMTHGYSALPPEVAEVGFEITSRALEKPSGIAQKIATGPYSFTFGEMGLLLSESQKNTLARYKLPAIL